jgi:uncharacterized Fe-S cluster-containing radical SAM superfamily enzyme
MHNYSSILFSGKCNSKCLDCIGNYPEFKNTSSNLDIQNLNGLEKFLEKVNDENLKDVSLSGINADPQQYLFESELINNLRKKIPNVILSLHTNGRLALQKLEEFNSYDKATLSFASFNKEIYKKIMGVESINIYEVIKNSKISIKLSMLLTEHNKVEINDYIKNAKNLGINRIAIRKLVDRENEIEIFDKMNPIKKIFENPVYNIDGVEVTIWNYTKSNIKGLYLFPDGSLRDDFR